MSHNGHRGGKRPRSNYPNNSPLFIASPDRACTNCMVKLTNQAIYKNRSCFQCHVAVPNSDGVWNENGWGRCPSCFISLNRNWCYCELCGWMNKVGIDAKQKRMDEARKQQEAVRTAAIKATQDRLRQVEMENAILRQQLEDTKRKDEEAEEDKLLSEVGMEEEKVLAEVGMEEETSKSNVIA